MALRGPRLEFAVGAFLVLALASLLVLAFASTNRQFGIGGGSYALTARFSNLGQLRAQAPVKIGGVVVGRVEGITFDDQTFQATVHLSMEKRYAFPKDSSLKILTSGLLGDQYVGIEAGADEHNLAQGDRIVATQSAVVLENLIGQFLYGKAQEGGTTE